MISTIQKTYLLTAMLLAALHVSAYDFMSDDGLCYNILSEDDRTVMVTYENYSNNQYVDGILSIPAKVIYNNKTYSVTSIGNSAFRDCSGLTQVTIPNSVTSIGDCAFYYCSALTQVTIGNSVTSIGDCAFSGCPLTEIHCFPIIPPTGENRTFDSDALKTAVLNVPIGCKADYEAVDPWRNFWNIQESDFSGIEDAADGDSDLRIAVCDGAITVEGGEASTAIEIYSVAGQLICRSYDRAVSGLAKGIYIVRVGGKTTKIAL